MEPSLGSVLSFFAIWSGLGLIAAVVLIHRGHDRRLYLVLGASLGPLLLVRLFEDDEQPAEPVSLRPGVPGSGRLGEGVGRLAVARVVTVEDALDEAGWSRGAAELNLAIAAGFVTGVEPALVLVPGRDIGAVVCFAARSGYDLVVIAGASTSRSRRRPRRLVRSLPVSLLVLGAQEKSGMST